MRKLKKSNQKVMNLLRRKVNITKGKIKIFFSFPLLLYFIKQPSLFYQHLFHHLKILIKVHQNWNVLTLTFLRNKFITYGLLCFSIFSILSDSFPLFTSTRRYIHTCTCAHTHTHTHIIYVYLYYLLLAFLGQKQKIFGRRYHRHRLCRWYNYSGKCTNPSRITAAKPGADKRSHWLPHKCK